MQAAWYQAGNAPGQPGTAIIAAHVDFQGSLGLFNGCTLSRRVPPIYVTDAAGTTRVFRVTTGKLAPKSDPSTVRGTRGGSRRARASPGSR